MKGVPNALSASAGIRTKTLNLIVSLRRQSQTSRGVIPPGPLPLLSRTSIEVRKVHKYSVAEYCENPEKVWGSILPIDPYT